MRPPDEHRTRFGIQDVLVEWDHPAVAFVCIGFPESAIIITSHTGIIVLAKHKPCDVADLVVRDLGLYLLVRGDLIRISDSKDGIVEPVNQCVHLS